MLAVGVLLLLLLAIPSRNVLLSVCVPVDDFIFATLGGVTTVLGGVNVGFMGDITDVGITCVCGIVERDVSCI